jgi:P-type Ca2+ transporter type 2C
MAAAVFVLTLRNQIPEDDARALTFVALIVAIVSLILVNRSFSSSLTLAVLRPNLTLLSILIGVGAILSACLTIPALRELFRFGPLHFDDLALAAGSTLLLLVVLELLKPLWRIR